MAATNPGVVAGAGGGGAKPPTNAGRAAGAVGGIVATLGRDLHDWTTEEAEKALGGLGDLLRWSILVPVVLFTVGAVVGRVGIWIGGSAEEWMVWSADGIISAGAFLGGVLVTWLWIKLAVYGNMVGLAGLGFEAVANAMPNVRTDVATRLCEGMERFLTWSRGWTAWCLGAFMYVMCVPIYRSLVVSMGAMLALLLLAAILSARFSEGPWACRVLIAGAVTVFVLFTLSLLLPGSMAAIRTWTGSAADGLVSWGDRENRLETVERTAEERENVQDAQLLDTKLSRQSEIRERVISDGCEGAFCTPEDRAEYHRLEREIRALRAGTSRNAPVAPNVDDSGESGVAPAKAPTARSGSRLPPPPSVSRTPRGSSRPSVRSRSGSRDRSEPSSPSRVQAPAPADNDFGYGGLDDYQL